MDRDPLARASMRRADLEKRHFTNFNPSDPDYGAFILFALLIIQISNALSSLLQETRPLPYAPDTGYLPLVT